MTARPDVLPQANAPDRVHYATGMLLDAGDFTDEQNYHRGRLAQALLYLFGSGTVAGLNVVWEPAIPAEEDNEEFPDGREETLFVEPGVAIDRLGRIIEIPRRWCIRFQRWYLGFEDIETLRQGVRGAQEDHILVDLFVRFNVCERGKRPAFAGGPFDALDAVQPSRLRDGHYLSLVVRTEHDEAGGVPPLPQTRFGDLPANPTLLDVQHALLNRNTWENIERDLEGHLVHPDGHAEEQDLTDLLLARLTVPIDGPGGAGQRPAKTEGAAVTVDNSVRTFVYSPAALALR